MNTLKILGVKIDDVDLKEATDLAVTWLGGKGKKYIVTPNPEFLIAAMHDPEFRKILNDADLSIPDGIGLKIANPKLKNRLAGVDLVTQLCKVAEEKGFTVAFLGGYDNVAIKTSECLKKKYPGIEVTFAGSGGHVDADGVLLGKLTLPKTDILFVGFGQVKQEKWIAKNLSTLPVRIAMGVGGTFDYLSGRIPRAPGVVRQIGLEWLFRLLMQPSRIKRQINLLKFIWAVMVH